MPFDPSRPADDSPLASDQMRGPLKGLVELIATISQGPPGPEGPPGEVTTAAMESAITLADAALLLNTARNPTSVSPLAVTPDAAYDPAQLQAVIDTLNALIAATRREP